MASKTSDSVDNRWQGPRMAHSEIGARLLARRAELGDVEAPRNAGTRRTASKRALLKAIAAAGGKW